MQCNPGNDGNGDYLMTNKVASASVQMANYDNALMIFQFILATDLKKSVSQWTSAMAIDNTTYKTKNDGFKTSMMSNVGRKTKTIKNRIPS